MTTVVEIDETNVVINIQETPVTINVDTGIPVQNLVTLDQLNTILIDYIRIE